MNRNQFFFWVIGLALLGPRAGAQTTRTKDMSLNIDSTRPADLPIVLLRSELPVSVRVGERWQGTLTLLNPRQTSLKGPIRAQIVYENRDTYRTLVQEAGLFDAARWQPGKAVVESLTAIVPTQLPNGATRVRLVLSRPDDPRPLQLPMKYDNPPGHYSLGKINVMATDSEPLKKRIVFFGDSVTEAASLPTGFISQLERMGGPVTAYELIGMGVGGDRVTSLRDRADTDVLPYRPDQVVIFVGVNDCGWFKWQPKVGGTRVPDYERILGELVQKFQQQNSRVVLMTPAVIGEKQAGDNPDDTSLNQYVDACKRVAQRLNCPLIDLRQHFTNYLRTHNPTNQDRGILTTDSVHLNEQGNRLIAEQLRAVLF